MTSSEFIPPMLNGVTASKVFLPSLAETPATLLDYLIQQFAHISASEWQQRCTDGLIYLANGNKAQPNTPYVANSHVFYYRFLNHEIVVPFEHKIIFENDHFLVADKPHFLTISPTGKYVQETLLVRLKKQTGNPDLTPIHRLDRETAGLVLFSKQVHSRGCYQQMFAEQKVTKVYHAIAPYNPELTFPIELALRLEKGQPFYTMQVTTGESNSETQIECLEYRETWAKYQLHPKTGKQHQLRVHLNYLNIPIKDDPFYPSVAHKPDDDFSAPLQLLAKKIQFIDPITQQWMQFESEQDLYL